MSLIANRLPTHATLQRLVVGWLRRVFSGPFRAANQARAENLPTPIATDWNPSVRIGDHGLPLIPWAWSSNAIGRSLGSARSLLRSDGSAKGNLRTTAANATADRFLNGKPETCYNVHRHRKKQSGGGEQPESVTSIANRRLGEFQNLAHQRDTQTRRTDRQPAFATPASIGVDRIMVAISDAALDTNFFGLRPGKPNSEQ